jgi:protein-S-isoprenylcysteine O-methyltransferase Ste14
VKPYTYVILAAGTILWCVPFIRHRGKGETTLQLDRRARWGVALECLGYSLLWQGPFWTREPGIWRGGLSVLFFALACLLSWSGARALGKQLRVDAALGANHELVRGGPYEFVRHPIYTSMLCVLLGTGFLIAPIYLALPAVVLFLIGTEIRMRIEDKLLASRFGDQAQRYQHTVPRLIPFLKL